MKPRHKLSAVIACYRDAPAVPIMHERLTAVFGKIGVDYEIIFVNDCSPDDAGAILADLADRDDKVTVVTHTRNFGSQNAFTSGMRIATGDAVVLLDGDLQDPPELIEDFYRKWREDYEVVYGQRVKRDATPMLKISYKLFYRVFRAMSYVPVPLDAGDFSLLDRRVVAQVENAQLRPGVVQRHPGNPLFAQTLPWEVDISHLYANVLFDQQEQLYKLAS